MTKFMNILRGIKYGLEVTFGVLILGRTEDHWIGEQIDQI